MSAPLAVPEDLSQNRGRLLRLAETIKTKKKSASHRVVNLKNDPGYSPNIEHLVFGTYRSVASPPKYNKGLSPGSLGGPTSSRAKGDPGGLNQCAECASIQCDPRTCACNNQLAAPSVRHGAVRNESNSSLRAPSSDVQTNGFHNDRILGGRTGISDIYGTKNGSGNSYGNDCPESYNDGAISNGCDFKGSNDGGGHPDGERRRPLTLADQVFLSPLLRNPNSTDPTGILSPPGMFKDNDPTTAIEAAVNRWVGADSRESAELLNQLANIAESQLVRKPPLPASLGPLSGNGALASLPSGLTWNSPCEEPASTLNKSVQIGKPQTPVRSKPIETLRTPPSTIIDSNTGAHDDYGFVAMYAAGKQGNPAPPGTIGSCRVPMSDPVELNRARSIPEITGIAGGVFHSGPSGASGSSAGSNSRVLNSVLIGIVDEPGLTGASGGRPRSMHEHLFNSTSVQNTAHSLPGLYSGRYDYPSGGTSGAMDLTQLSHLQEPTSHSCNSSPQKILNKFSKTFSLRRNKKKPIEKGYSLESDVPRAISTIRSANSTAGFNGVSNSDKQPTGDNCSDGNGTTPMSPQGLVLQSNNGIAHAGGGRVEHSPSLSKDSGIHLNSNSTEETTSSKSGSEDGNNSFNPRRSRALQRTSRRQLRRSQSQPCEINTSSEAEDDDLTVCAGPWPGAGAVVCEPSGSDQTVAYVEALWDHITLDPEELAFRAGEVIRVSDRSDRDWWWGALGTNEQRTGWFPANFVRLRVNQENKDRVHGALQSSTGLHEMNRIRTKVVQELITTEQDFVQHLRDIVEGYLLRCRSRPAMFTAEQVGTIFGNVEQLYVFQKSFLTKLASCVNPQQPHASCIGDCFLRFRKEFSIYSEYCNNHPLAMAELEQLYRQAEYAHFFENCRRSRGGMSDISLGGFLLTPVQRICKYPLQLAELLKYTPPGHPDRAQVSLALESMRGVAHMVNERKRRMESLETLEVWQRAVLNWEGPELIETSSLLIHSADVTRYTLNGQAGGGSAGGNDALQSYSKEVVTMWLFDNVIIYCRREFIRSSLSYRGRIYTSALTLVNISDGKEPNFGITVKNAFKLYCASTEKWFLFSCRSLKDKTRWLASFERERDIVRKDKELGYTITENTRKLTRLSILHKARPQVQGRRTHRPDVAITEALDVEEGKLPPLKDRSGSLPSHFAPDFGKEKKWYHFGSSKKTAKKRV
ncbi:uncharacterized protein LOC111273087 [Varroa jacobsoni]|uniref:uncharacterized protein LOC111273087 n=1 Tax=Varroa jacobsoni TaxID=62625 RepID=UPI000BF4D327|nr:uncharacterized protein LOC111273087 [Varroa jacobsoni]XP_022710520.1 uncharacterized protein LOC111273087 [Varroa jacobsoni]